MICPLSAENRCNPVSVELLQCAENSGNGSQIAAVIPDGLNSLVQCQACGHGRGQDDDILIPNHGKYVLLEYHLAVAVELRSHDVDSLMGIHRENTGAGQFLSQETAHDLGSLKTYNGIYHRVIEEQPRQAPCYLLGLAEPGL